MKGAKADSSTISKLFARTPHEQEILPGSWLDLITDILNFGRTCNALITIQGEEGSGKTTFIKMLSKKSAPEMDCIHVSPAHGDIRQGWILSSIGSWLSSDLPDAQKIHALLGNLSDSQRPILICIDNADVSHIPSLPVEISSLLNLADASGIKMSVIIFSGSELSQKLTADKRTGYRIVHHAVLPHFNREQASAYINMKLSSCFDNISSGNPLTDIQVEQIIKDSSGIPGRIIHLITAALGHNSSPAQKQIKDKTQTEEVRSSPKQRESSKIQALEDLLAPPKN